MNWYLFEYYLESDYLTHFYSINLIVVIIILIEENKNLISVDSSKYKKEVLIEEID